ncbi:Uncharacterised protein [Chromobacterium violaceum]|uniref:Uncharacterized protein n=1 Tax=Chromobacterium violaceum TaxID=536 RepID=A0A3S4JW73_CHRVL|nr:Uncharacterised protein [Chromobacterium violaceum]
MLVSPLAVVGVRADKHPAAGVVGDDFVQIAVMRTANRAALLPALDFERVVVEGQAFHLGVGRNRVQPLFAAGAEQQQGRVHVELGVVEFRNRRWRGQIPVVHHHRIVVAGGDVAEAGDVLVQLDVHQAVFLVRVQLAGFHLAGLQRAQRFRLRHLEDQDLAGFQRRFRDAMAGLDQRRVGGASGGGDAGHATEEAADVDGVGGVVGALVDDFQHIVAADDAGRQLDAAGAQP